MNLTIAEALRDAAEHLLDNKISDARRDAALLLSFVLERDKTFLIVHDDYVLSETESERFFAAVSRRAAGEPVQYVTGRQEFFGLEFEVNKDVLIPRPETEILVEAAIEILRELENKTFCDVGTGSGCIAVSILKNVPEAKAFALDISPQALMVAQRNAFENGVVNASGNFALVRSDCFEAFRLPSVLREMKFSVIVSNPPYIPNKDLPGLPREVRGFEPHVALFGGDAGTEIVGRLLADAPEFLDDNGFLLFEIGFTQGEAVRRMIDEKVWRLVEIKDDLAGIPRIVILQLNS